MAESTIAPDDPFNLDRFVQAQASDYTRALSEIRAGRKRSHWMWYIFPQFAGLGFSGMSRRYAIQSVDEAAAYLQHLVLGSRLIEICTALLELPGCSAHAILGSPDDFKLRSCATLFAQVSSAGSVFHQVLEKYFAGQPDQVTMRLLADARGRCGR